jgi:hypothetical protein
MSWQPTKKYRADLWVLFKATDRLRKEPIGFLTKPDAFYIMRNSAHFNAMQLRYYAKMQPGKAAGVVPLKNAIELLKKEGSNEQQQ